VLELDVGGCAGIRSAAHGVGAVVGDFEVFQARGFEGVHEGVDRAVAVAFDFPVFSIDGNRRVAMHAATGLVDQFVGDLTEMFFLIHKVIEKCIADFIDAELAAVLIGEIIDVFPDNRMHRLRKIETVFAI